MKRLPVEGTYFSRVYESAVKADANSFASAIIGLYSESLDSRSMMHKLDVDELWYFLDGDPIELVLLDENGELSRVVLGSDLDKGHRNFHLIKAGVWQAAYSMGQYSLYTCIAVPAFKNDIFEGADESLLLEFPEHAEVLKEFIPTSKYLPDDYKE